VVQASELEELEAAADPMKAAAAKARKALAFMMVLEWVGYPLGVVCAVEREFRNEAGLLL
jgi:hypothetical protein